MSENIEIAAAPESAPIDGMNKMEVASTIIVYTAVVGAVYGVCKLVIRRKVRKQLKKNTEE